MVCVGSVKTLYIAYVLTVKISYLLCLLTESNRKKKLKSEILEMRMTGNNEYVRDKMHRYQALYR